MTYNPYQVTAFSQDEAKKLSKSSDVLGGSKSKKNEKLPTGPAVPGVNPVRLEEPKPILQPKMAAVVTSQPAVKKLSAAQGTVDLATQAMKDQAEVQRRIADAQAYNEAHAAELQADTDARNAKAEGDRKLANDVQSTLDKVKGEAGVEPPPEPEEEESGYFDQHGAPIGASSHLIREDRPNQLMRQVANGKVKTSQDPLQAEFDQRSAQAELAWKEHNEQIEQMKNGTLPLTANQQAQLDSARAQFDQLKAEQEKANQNFQGGMKVLQQNLGIDRYAADQAMGNLNQAVSDGVMKMARIDTAATAALSSMESGFREENYAMIDKAYEDYTAFLSQRQTVISNIQAAAAAAVKEERDFNYKVKQDEISNAFKQGDLDLRDKQTMIDAAYKDATITLEQRKILNDEIKMQNDMQIQRARLALDRQAAANANILTLQNGQQLKFNRDMQVAGFVADQQHRSNQLALDYSKLSLEERKLAVDQSGGQLQLKDGTVVSSATGRPPAAIQNSNDVPMASAIDPVQIPGVTKMANSGVVYFDPSQFADDGQKKMAQTLAMRMGIQVLSPTEIKVVRGMDSALAGLDQFESDYKELAPTSWSGKLTGEVRGRLGKFFDTERGDKLTKFQTSTSNLLNAVSAISDDNNPRLTKELIERVENSLPRLDDAHNFNNMIQSDVGTGLAQIRGSRQAIYNTMTAYLPNAVLPRSGEKRYGSVDSFLADHPEAASQAADLARQGYMPSDIILVLNQ